MTNKIVLAINDLSFGGGQRTVIAEANSFHNLGFEVYILTLLNKEQIDFCIDDLIIPLDHVINISFESFFDPAAFRRLVVWLKRVRPNYIFSNLFFTNTLIRLAKIFCPSIRVIIREGNMPTEKSWLVCVIDSILSLWTFKIIVNAGAIKQSFKRLWISQNKIVVIYNGLDKYFFNKNQSARIKLRNELGASSKSLAIITVASFTKKKGYGFLIDVYKQLESDLNKYDVKIWLIGDGPEKKNIQLLITNYQLQDKVSLLGARQDIKELLNAADIFVLPSLWEGMPNALWEAMASGLPVIATNVGGVSEIINNGTNGLLVQPEDATGLRLAIRKLLIKSELREKIADEGIKTIKDFTWDRHIDEIIKLLKSKS
ncbi:MAG: glycosyltransferase [bacterium]|nr:glycosyltransferase [bacterium]